MRFLGSVVLALFFVTTTTAQVFYGVTRDGGTGAGGTIFKINQDGSSHSVEHNFVIDGPQGSRMDYCQMVKNPATGKMYGVMTGGGVADQGVLFEYDPATNTYTKKIDFADNMLTGINAIGSLAFGPDGKLYGTTNGGGIFSNGIIFEYNIGTNTLTRRADFQSAITGHNIFSGMVLAGDGMFYGVTYGGGGFANGVIYQFNPVSGALTKRKDFSGSNGSSPLRAPVLYNGKLYGATNSGGVNENGTIYKYDPATDVLETVYQFMNGPDGRNPNSTFAVLNNFMYGVTSGGGDNDYGTIFQFDPNFNTVGGLASFDYTTTGKGDVNILTLASDGMLYGTTEYGGSSATGPQTGGGVLFQFDPDVHSLLAIAEFTGFNEGLTPKSGLTIGNDGLLYGTTAIGGAHWGGTIFSFNTSTVSLSKMMDLNTATDAVHPSSPPIQHPNGKLYGVSENGGTFGRGMIYEFDPLSKTYQSVHDFDDGTDGANPYGSLVLFTDGHLYGTAFLGGTYDKGVIYSYEPTTNSFVKRIDFDGSSDFGSNPRGSLLLASDGFFYGMTTSGGANGMGILFSYLPGSSFDDLVQFDGTNGRNPQGELVEASGNLYGMTQFGGANDRGALFEYQLAGGPTAFSLRKDFQEFQTGSQPHGSLVLHPNGKLYGMARYGGNNTAGTIFEYDHGTDILVKKIDLDYGTTGGQPLGTLAVGAEDKLYGFTIYGGTGGWGALFEYDPSTNGIVKKFDFTPATGSAPRFGHLSSVIFPPTIDEVIPPYGNAGATVFILGENFNADPAENIVYFGPVRATVTEASGTMLEVVVPNGAEFGPVSVTVANLTAESPKPFTPTFAFNGGITGSYETAFTKSGSSGAKRMVMADFDGDGYADAAMATEGGVNVHVYRNSSSPGAPSFENNLDYFNGGTSYTLDAADMDGDGKLDLIAAGTTSVGILRNESTLGTLSFAPGFNAPFGAGCLSAKVVDVSGDGKPDIIAVGGSTGFRVYQNISTPGVLNFVDTQFSTEAVNSGITIWDVAAADIDGDQKIDIVVPVPDDPIASSYMAVFRNTHTPGTDFNTGSLAPPVKIAAPGYSAGLDVADLDFDGLPELIVGSGTDYASLRVYKNFSSVGGVAFGPAINLNSNLQVWDPRVADVNGDGRPDILAAHNGNGRISVLENKYTIGALQASDFTQSLVTTGGSPLNVAVCDVDANGLPDMIVADEAFGQLQIFQNKNAYPRPIVTSVTPSFASAGASVVIAGSNFTASNAVYFGATRATVTNASSTSLTATVPPQSTFAPVSVTTNGLTAISPSPFSPDFTTSGVIDANSFEDKVDEATGFAPQVLAFGDLNADGLTDLLVPNNSDNSVSVMQNLSVPGTADFARLDLSTLGAPISAAIGDIDGDKQQDFVVTGDLGLSIFHHTNTTGSIVPEMFTRTDLLLSGFITGVSLGDLDGDGKLDIVASSGGDIMVARNVAAPGAIASTDFQVITLTVPYASTHMAVGDLDGDERPEIVVGSLDGGSSVFSILQNFNGPGGLFVDSFTRIDLNAGGARPYSISLTDMDGDGKLDIVTANNIGATVSVLRNIINAPGTISVGSFEAAIDYATGASPLLVRCADVDGDLRPDILTSNDGDGTVTVLKNMISSPGSLIATSFQAKVDFVVGAGPESVAVADIDGDGKPDILATSESANTVAVLLNVSMLGVPTLFPVQNITTTDFKAEWSAVAGATGYRIDVSSDDFVNMVPGYSDQAVVETSLTVTGLTPGLAYKYRVRAANSTGSGGNSNEVSVALMPEPPANLSWTLVTSTSFVAMWDASPGAIGYRLDVSTDNFATFAEGYEDFEIPAITTTHDVTGLAPGTTYRIRVRTVTSAFTSANSSALEVETRPSAPNATAATSVTALSFTANWTGTSPADEYRLDVSDVATFITTLGAYDNLQVLTTSEVVTGLSAGTTYFYRIRASNSSGSSEDSDVESVTTVPPAPGAMAASGIGQTSFTANWTASLGADDYRLDVSLDDFTTFLSGFENLTVSTISVEVTGALPGTNYNYRVRAANDNGTSANSADVQVLTVPSIPTVTAATDVTAASFTANWNASNGATGYLLDVCLDNLFVNNLAGYDNELVTGTSAVVSGLASGTTYFYRVRAQNSSGESASSNTGDITILPAAPDSPLATAISQTTFTANWDAAFGATSYRIDVSDVDDSFSTFFPGYENRAIAGTSHEVTVLAPGHDYWFRVRAENASGISSNSANVFVRTVPANPVINAGTVVTTFSFEIAWEPVTGATGYELEVATVNDFTNLVSGYDPLTLTDYFTTVTGLTSGSTYYCRVRALNSSGISGYSIVQAFLLTPLAPVALNGSSISSNEFNANWVGVVGAVSYRLDVSANNFANMLSGFDDQPVTGTFQQVTGLTPGTNYKYRLRAISPGGTSANSNEISVITVPPAPVANAPTATTQSSFQANWASTQGADLGYHLDVSDDDFANVLQDYNNFPVTGTSHIVTGLTAGTAYKYRVRAVNGSGASSWSNEIAAAVIPAIPVAIAANNPGETGFTANWLMSAGATEYEVDVSDDNFTSVLPDHEGLVMAGGTSLIINGLEGGVPYMYRVRAGNDGGYSGNSAIITIALKPAAPLATDAADVTDESFTAHWTASNGATGYRVDVTADDFTTILASYNDIAETTTSVPVNIGLAAGASYKYRVRAQNGVGTSSNSNEISVTLIPAAPTATAATGINLTGFTATWGSVSGADGYYLEVSADDFVTPLTGYDNLPVAGTSHAVTGLTALTEYKYRVRAHNVGGTSDPSNAIIAVPDTAEPPTVSSFSPLGGPTGTVVNVIGTNFFEPIQVEVGDVSATSIAIVSPTSLNVTVPATATTGKVKVTVGAQFVNSDTDFIVDGTPPNILLPASPFTPTSTAFKLDITITDDESQGNVSAVVYYRSVAGDDPFGSPHPLVREGTTSIYSHTIPSTFISANGAEYYVEASSYGGSASTESSIKTVQVDPGGSGLIIPYDAFGELESNYRIISIPLVLANKSVADVFHDDLDPSIRKNWRIQRYSNGATNDLGAASLLAPGEGYWLIVREQDDPIDTGPGKTAPATRDNPFLITLKPGWNQIGNPYNFNLYWPDVVAANPAESANFDDKVYTFTGAGASGWVDSNVLKKMEGAFVNNTSTHDIALQIPAQYNSAAGRGHESKEGQPLDNDNWEVEFVLTQGNNLNAISGFGMHRESKEGQDRYDHLTMPRFFEKYIEVNHTRNTDKPLTTDIVPTAESYVWEFDVESNFDGEDMVLEWDNSYFGDNQKGLVLWDEKLQLGTDMRLASSYSFKRKESRRFKIFFGNSDEISDMAVATRLVFHSVSPNPTAGDAKVAFSIPTAGDVTFDVYDQLGRKVWSDTGTYEKGYHEVDLTGRFTAGQGMVIIQLGMGSDLQQKRLQIR
jgi:uncharacterized repeat protein (TIGR03803 family)